jgi:hypothetical protein
MQAHVPRRRTLGDRLDGKPSPRWDVEHRREAICEEKARCPINLTYRVEFETDGRRKRLLQARRCPRRDYRPTVDYQRTLANGKNTGATQAPAAEFQEIAYPSADLLKVH